MRKNFIFKMSVVFVMGIMALGQVSCSSKTETNVDKEGEASSESQGDVFFQTRGIILSWDDVKTIRSSGLVKTFRKCRYYYS